ncbi:hypothetical protein ABT142_32655 [Streptomyces sp. NPDC001857]|uniref:hypothetical protein n=1 Tax=unclassified Streptomyces TaxID=2593676 RepID=UPI0033187AD9
MSYAVSTTCGVQPRLAALTSDLAAVGGVAAVSARIDQRLLPVPRFDDLVGVAESAGTAGPQIAHSGSIGAFLFDPAAPDHSQAVARAEKELSASRIDDCWHCAEQPGSVRPLIGRTD